MKDSAVRWLYEVPGSKKLYILLLTIADALHGASGVFYALLLKGAVDSAAGGNSSGFWRFMAYILLLAALQIALRAFLRWMKELTKSEFENIFKRRLMQNILSRDYLRVSTVHSGEWLNRLTNDTTVVANGCAEIIPDCAGMLVKLISALVMIIVLEPLFSAILIPGGILMVVFSWLFRKRMKRLHKDIQEADGRLRVFLQERIGSLMMIRSFAAEEQTAGMADARMQAHKDARMRRIAFSNLCNIGFGAAMSGMYIIGVGWCGYGILRGTITFGTLTAITQLISQIQTPFANISGYLPRYYAMLASAERLMEAETLEEESTVARPADEVMEAYSKDIEAIGLSHVSFTYLPASDDLELSSKDEMPVVIEDLSIEIRKRSYVAFMGHSGCGKSTVLRLLMCVYKPDSGTCYYRDADGRAADLGPEWRRLFAYVPQGNQLMSGTIREIVSFAEPGLADDGDRIHTALAVACADEFIAELDDGIDTLLGERGAGLSEGQMQRIAIARAVFSGRPVLLLDEATSALDAQTERRLLQNLRDMTDKTVVIVTHRPAAISICDQVVEFTENGIREHNRQMEESGKAND